MFSSFDRHMPMKGVAIRTVILLVLGIIVMAIALYFLVYVTNFDSLFLSNDQRILKQYATCALAYCTDGASSIQVKEVGCLKSESGKCTLSCADVKTKFYDTGLENNGVPAIPTSGDHYCGEDAKIPFQFSGVSLGGTVPLKSGQMESLTTQPKWICDPVKLPFTNIYIDNVLPDLPGLNTADWQFYGVLGSQSNCIMLSKITPDLWSFIPVATQAAAEKPGQIAAGGCFTGMTYDPKNGLDELYTPLLGFVDTRQKTWPSGIYLDLSVFSTSAGSSSPAECNLHDPIYLSDAEIKQKYSGLVDDITGLLNKATSLNFLIDKSCYEQSQKAIQNPTLNAAPDPATCKFRTLSTEEAKNFKLEDTQVLVAFKDLTDQQKASYIYGFVRSQLQNNFLDIGGVPINSCNFKTQEDGKRLTYYVSADPTYPGEYLVKKPEAKTAYDPNAEHGFVGDFLNIFGLGAPLNAAMDSAYQKIIEGVESPVSGVSGNCGTVTLGRDVSITSATSTGTTTSSSTQSTVTFSDPTNANMVGDLSTSPDLVSDGNNLYLFYQRNTGGTIFNNDAVSEIHEATSTDGKAWTDQKIQTDNLVSAYEPTAAKFGNTMYLAFGNKSEDSSRKVRYTINVTALDGSKSWIISDDFDGTKEKGGPSMVSFGGKLYLFYHQKEGNGRYSIYYRTLSSGNGDWSDAVKVPTPSNGRLNADDPNVDSMYPSATVSSDGGSILLSYSSSNSQNKIELFGFSQFTALTSFDIYAATFDGAGKVESLGKLPEDTASAASGQVSDAEANGLKRQGFSKILQASDGVYVFYDEDKTVADPVNHPDALDTHVGYKKLVNGEWQGPSQGELFPDKNTKNLQPTAAIDSSGNIELFFSSYIGGDGKWTIMQSTGTFKTTQTQADVVKVLTATTDKCQELTADKCSYASSDTISFTGHMEFQSGSAEGKQVTTDLSYATVGAGTIFVPSTDFAKTYTLDKDGNFASQFKPNGRKGTYTLKLTYGGTEKDFGFTVN